MMIFQESICVSRFAWSGEYSNRSHPAREAPVAKVCLVCTTEHGLGTRTGRRASTRVNRALTFTAGVFWVRTTAVAAPQGKEVFTAFDVFCLLTVELLDHLFV